MPLDRIDSIYDIPAIQQEFAALKTGLADSQKGLVDLYTLIKGFKDTNITTLAANTDKLSQAINGSVQATASAAKNYDALAQKIAQQTGAIRENAAAITGSNQAYDQLIKQSVRNKLASDELTQSAREVKIAYEKNKTTFEQYTTSLESIKAAQQTLKISNQDITKSLNSLEKQSQSAAGSTDQLRARLAELQQQYDKLNEAERGTEGGQSLLKTIQSTDQAVKSLEATTGRFKSNVGNYSGALKPLEEELQRVNAQLAEMDKMGKGGGVQHMGAIGFKTPSQQQSEGLSGQAGAGPTNLRGGIGFDPARYKELSTQAEALNLIISQQEKGFSSVTQQIRSSERALATLEAAGLEGSRGFEQLRESTVSASQAQKEFLRQEKLLESEAPLLGALTLAAKGLGGAYAVGAGAVSLFADGNEKVEKELNKLVAIMTILQGLHEAYELLQQAGAVSTAIRMALDKAANAVMGQKVVVTEAAVAANLELAASDTAVEAATIAEVAALEAQTAAAGEAAVATEAVAVAGVEASTALLATGIGAAIAAIAVAVLYLVSKIPDWIKGSHMAAKQQEELADSVKKANDVLMEQAKMIEGLDSVTKKYYQELLSQASSSGQNAYQQFAIKKKIAEEEKGLAQDQIDLLGATNAQQSELAGTIDNLNAKQREAIRIQQEILAIPEQHQTSEQKDQLAAAKKNEEYYSKLAEGPKALYEAGKKAREDLFAANSKSYDLELQEAKLSADEQRRLVLTTAKLEVDAQKDKNSKILSDQASTLQQRLAAIRSNARQEKKAAEAEFKNISADPSTTPTQLVEARRKLNASFAQIDRDAAKETVDTNRTYYEKDRDARLEIYKQSVQDSLKYDQDILSKKIGHGENDTTGDAKLNALTNQLQLQKNLSEQNRQEDLDAEGLTAEQKKAINKKYNSEIENFNIDFLKTQRELEKEIRDATLADWDQYYEDRKTQLDKETNAEVAALNDRLVKRKISQQKYDDEIKLINDKNALDSINLEVMNDYIKVQAYKDGTKEKSDAEKKLTDDLKSQNDQQTKNQLDIQEIARAKVIRTLQDVEGQSQNYGSAILDVINIGYNTQKVHLEQLEARQQRAYEQNAKNISNTSASEEQKAIRLKILDDQRMQQKEINDRKQRSLDIQKSQFDKAKDILGIITGTALAVVKALPNIPLAVSVGILGAAELTAAIATPLPKYKEGTDDHPGGLAVTGDGGVSELILEPGRPARWSDTRPTIESLLPHTKVLPPEKIEEMIMSGMFINQRGVLIQQAETGNKQELREIRDAIVWSAQMQKESAKANRPRIVNKVTITANWHTYIHNSVFK